MVERVTVFIDGSNIYHGLKNNFGRTVLDYNKFGRELSGSDRHLVRVYIYTSPLPRVNNEQKYQAQQRFFAKLHQTPYVELKLGKLVPRGNTMVEKGVDILMAIDMLKYANSDNYDTAIIVTGDGDFAEAVTAVKDQGKHVELAYFHGGANALKQVCDKFTLLDNTLLNRCLP